MRLRHRGHRDPNQEHRGFLCDRGLDLGLTIRAKAPTGLSCSLDQIFTRSARRRGGAIGALRASASPRERLLRIQIRGGAAIFSGRRLGKRAHGCTAESFPATKIFRAILFEPFNRGLHGSIPDKVPTNPRHPCDPRLKTMPCPFWLRLRRAGLSATKKHVFQSA